MLYLLQTDTAEVQDNSDLNNLCQVLTSVGLLHCHPDMRMLVITNNARQAVSSGTCI